MYCAPMFPSYINASYNATLGLFDDQTCSCESFFGMEQVIFLQMTGFWQEETDLWIICVTL